MYLGWLLLEIVGVANDHCSVTMTVLEMSLRWAVQSLLFKTHQRAEDKKKLKTIIF